MKKVLVADDTKNIRLLLTKCLQMEGYEVKAANDGFAALESLLGEPFDLAFIDIKMPNLSGTEVIRKAREKGIVTPVIVITAYATVKNAVECTQMGAVAYLQKPFTADKVREVLKDSFGRETMANTGREASLESAAELVRQHSFSRALRILKELLPDRMDDPEVYLLLSKAYGGLGDAELEGKFRQVHGIFAGTQQEDSSDSNMSIAPIP